MHRPTSMNTTGGGRPNSCTLKDAPANNCFTGILLRIQYPVTSAGGMITTPTIRQLLESALGSFTLKYGKDLKQVPYNAVPGQDLELIQRFVRRSPVAHNLGSITWGNVGNYTARCDVHIPFTVEALVGGRKYAPGWSQVQGMKLEIVEGTANLPLGLTRTTPATMEIDVDLLSTPSQIDRYCPVLSYYRVDGSDFTTRGPDGIHLAVWEENAAQAATAISLYDLAIGDIKLTGQIPPYIAGAKYEDTWDDEGNTAVSDTVTVLWSPDEGETIDELPAGEIVFHAPAKYYTPFKVRGLYWPVLDEDEARNATKEASRVAAQPVLATTTSLAHTASIMHARSAPVEFFTSAHADFTLREGLMAGPAEEPYVSIPEHRKEVKIAQVKVAATSGDTTAQAARAQVLEDMSRNIPGLAKFAAGAAATGNVPHAQAFADGLKNISGKKGAQQTQDFLRKLGL